MRKGRLSEASTGLTRVDRVITHQNSGGRHAGNLSVYAIPSSVLHNINEQWQHETNAK